MSKTSIVIIIICTVIIAVVVFFTIREEPGIKDIYFVNSSNISEDPLKGSGITDFQSHGSSIYVVVPAAGIKSGDTLDIEWIYMGENGHDTIQRDNIGLEEDGGGNIAVYLLKRDSAYEPGAYKVKVQYNGSQEKEAFFTVTGDQASNP